MPIFKSKQQALLLAQSKCDETATALLRATQKYETLYRRLDFEGAVADYMRRAEIPLSNATEFGRVAMETLKRVSQTSAVAPEISCPATDSDTKIPCAVAATYMESPEAISVARNRLLRAVAKHILSYLHHRYE